MTAKEFAELIGVSQPTVSRALNGNKNVAEKTKRYILEKANEYGFVLNSQARSLRTKKTGTIGVLFPAYFHDMSHNLMFTYIYDKIQRELLGREYDVMTIAGDQRDRTAGNALGRIVRSGKIDGIINFQPCLNEDKIQLIENCGLPCVSLHSGLQDSEKFHQFILDEEDAGRWVAAFFAGNGRTNVYLGLTGVNGEQEPRLYGFRSELEQRGKTLAYVLPCGLSMEEAGQAIERERALLRRTQVNLFVYNDFLAIGAVQTLKKLSIGVPSQVQVVGMDDIPMASWFSPRLSTMASPVDLMVRECCDLLLSLIHGLDVEPYTKYYHSHFMKRDTTF